MKKSRQVTLGVPLGIVCAAPGEKLSVRQFIVLEYAVIFIYVHACVYNIYVLRMVMCVLNGISFWLVNGSSGTERIQVFK